VRTLLRFAGPAQTQFTRHILYAFANVRQDTGEVFLSDLWADQDIHYPGDSWNDQGKNLYGNFKAIYKIKQANRHLKVLLSIGGWTYSPNFHPVVVNPSLRRKFVESSVKILEDYGLDGLDVDYEYPQNDEQATGYVHLLKEMREALDRHAESKGRGCDFLLTVRLRVLPAARPTDIAIRRMIRLPPLADPTTTISFMWRK
jgi:chitinase